MGENACNFSAVYPTWAFSLRVGKGFCLSHMAEYGEGEMVALRYQVLPLLQIYQA